MSESQNPAITREEVLAPFSRDHYTGLVQANRLRKAGESEADRHSQLVIDFLDAWDREIGDHFNDEERLLLDIMESADQERMLAEHGDVRNYVAQLRDNADNNTFDVNTMKALGELLEAHIRWEERDLFNRLQQALSAPQRAALESETIKIDPARGRKPRETKA
jgi:hemerythrin-like domain-containing protein